MRNAAVTAVFDAAVRILEVPSAVFAQSRKGTVTEQAVEVFFVYVFVTWEEFACFVIYEFVVIAIGHFLRPPVRDLESAKLLRHMTTDFPPLASLTGTSLTAVECHGAKLLHS